MLIFLKNYTVLFRCLKLSQGYPSYVGSLDSRALFLSPHLLIFEKSDHCDGREKEHLVCFIKELDDSEIFKTKWRMRQAGNLT